MRHAILIILFFGIFSANAQKTDPNLKVSNLNSVDTLKVETEQKDNLKTNMISIQEEMKLKINRFRGKILVVNEMEIMYDDEVLLIYNTEKKYKLIFELGIFYPSLLTGQVETGQERIKELDSMIIRNDSLRITDFKEISLRETYNKKRFTFLLFYKGLSNPTEYFIELTNDKANKETDFETFIKGAKLTSLVKGSLLI